MISGTLYIRFPDTLRMVSVEFSIYVELLFHIYFKSIPLGLSKILYVSTWTGNLTLQFSTLFTHKMFT